MMKLSFNVETTGKKILLELLQDPEIQDELANIIESRDLEIQAEIDQDKLEELTAECVQEELKQATFTVHYDG